MPLLSEEKSNSINHEIMKKIIGIYTSVVGSHKDYGIIYGLFIFCSIKNCTFTFTSTFFPLILTPSQTERPNTLLRH